MNPPWQIAWPFSISPRTDIVSSACPASTSTIVIPRPFDAVSRAYIAAATRSARSRASAGASTGWCSPTELASRRGAPRDERRDPVAILAVVRGKIREHIPDDSGADRIGPGDGTARIVDTLLHRDVDRLGNGDALQHSLGRF